MPFKNIHKSREYSRLYMRKLRATKKGLTIKPNKLNPVKPAIVKPNVKPKPCRECQALATTTKSYENLQKQMEKYQNQKTEPTTDLREYWRQQKKRQKEKAKASKK